MSAKVTWEEAWAAHEPGLANRLAAGHELTEPRQWERSGFKYGYAAGLAEGHARASVVDTELAGAERELVEAAVQWHFSRCSSSMLGEYCERVISAASKGEK